MNGYTLSATSPCCGAELIPGDAKVLAPDQSTAEARCDKCLALWRLDVTATEVEPPFRPRFDPDRARAAAAESAVPDSLMLASN